MKQIDKDTISLEWSTDDVLSECDWLTKEQAREVLKMSNKDFRSYLLGIESLCGKHLIDVPIALENKNFKMKLFRSKY